MSDNIEEELISVDQNKVLEDIKYVDGGNASIEKDVHYKQSVYKVRYDHNIKMSPLEDKTYNSLSIIAADGCSCKGDRVLWPTVNGLNVGIIDRTRTLVTRYHEVRFQKYKSIDDIEMFISWSGYMGGGENV